jgi:hypothetical protein
MTAERAGLSGRIAAYFQAAQITPLLALILLLLGLAAVLVTPREEEPQINVTMANVIVRSRERRCATWNRWWPRPPSRCSVGSRASST